MTGIDRGKFAASFAAMAAVFGKEPNSAVVEIYFRALERFSATEVEAGISKACSTLKFFPKPVELIECITGGDGRLEDRAMVEACRVLDTIKSVGTYASVVFDDPVTQAVIVQHFGGWARFAELRQENEKWFLRDFASAYQAFARVGVKHFGALPGISAQQNALKGFDHREAPVMIGDVEKAKAVLAARTHNAIPDGEGVRHISRALGKWQRPATGTAQ